MAQQAQSTLPLALQTAEPRRGKWATEEEEYTTRIISDFHKGLLDIPSGITLRQHLSNQLNCDPMRITKKFARMQTIGKCAYVPVTKTQENSRMINDAQEDIRRLQQLWHVKLQQQDRDFIRKRLRSEKHINDLQFVPSEDLSSLKDLTPGEEKISNALKDFINENDMFILLSWVRRSTSILRHSTSTDELDAYVKHGERLLEHIKKQIIEYYTQDSGDDGGYDESSSGSLSNDVGTTPGPHSSSAVSKKTLISCAKAITQTKIAMQQSIGQSANRQQWSAAAAAVTNHTMHTSSTPVVPTASFLRKEKFSETTTNNNNNNNTGMVMRFGGAIPYYFNPYYTMHHPHTADQGFVSHNKIPSGSVKGGGGGGGGVMMSNVITPIPINIPPHMQHCIYPPHPGVMYPGPSPSQVTVPPAYYDIAPTASTSHHHHPHSHSQYPPHVNAHSFGGGGGGGVYMPYRHHMMQHQQQQQLYTNAYHHQQQQQQQLFMESSVFGRPPQIYPVPTTTKRSSPSSSDSHHPYHHHTSSDKHHNGSNSSSGSNSGNSSNEYSGGEESGGDFTDLPDHSSSSGSCSSDSDTALTKQTTTTSASDRYIPSEYIGGGGEDSSGSSGIVAMSTDNSDVEREETSSSSSSSSRKRSNNTMMQLEIESDTTTTTPSSPTTVKKKKMRHDDDDDASDVLQALLGLQSGISSLV
eukprot:gene1622-3141_t